MTIEEYRNCKVKVIEKSIQSCKEYLASEDSKLHRNITASCKRRLNGLIESLSRFANNQLTKEDIYYFHTLYEDKAPDLKYISAV